LHVPSSPAIFFGVHGERASNVPVVLEGQSDLFSIHAFDEEHGVDHSAAS
jgi:hypothetical protein